MLSMKQITNVFNSYRIFGPTTIHLRQELCLWISLILLTVSTMEALYGDTKWSSYDFQFLLLVALWLSRHLFIRWLVTSDNSTNRSPTLVGVLAHWITSLFMAGQYFDRPNPKAVAKYLGTHQVDDSRRGAATLSSFFHPSILFTWQMLKVWIIYPTLKAKEHVLNRIVDQDTELPEKKLSSKRNNVSHNNHSGSKRSSRKGGGKGERERTKSGSIHVKVNKAYSHWSKFWNSYGPPLQMMITISTTAYYVWGLLFSENTDEESHALTMNTRAENDYDPLEHVMPYGTYRKLERPKWSQVLFSVSFVGVMLTILIFGRVVSPIGELASGGNVLKAVRNESKAYGFNPSGGKSKSKTQREHADLPWAEQFQSIIGDNRFRLLCKLSSIRFAENIIICAFLPCTYYACRFMRHCPEGTSIQDLSIVFYPMGIDSTQRNDGLSTNEFALIGIDRGYSWMTLFSVILITGSVVFTQAATLNRSYLGIMGYLAGGWSIVDMKDPAHHPSAKKPSPWDPRRRYKKGDLIVQDLPAFGGKAIYVATTNAPEGIPYDLSLRATHDLFRNELAHPATSTLISAVATLQLCLIIILMIMIAAYLFMNYQYRSLIWTLAANLVSAYGTMRARAVPNFSEMRQLAQDFS